MIDQTYLEFLQSLETGNRKHSGRPLLDHLIGTHDLLESWGNSTAVCLAGLFHSVYGTTRYRPQSLDLQYRTQLITLIGPDAEQLAYLFSATPRRDLIRQANADVPTLRDRYTGGRNLVETGMVHRLLELEFANFFEQNNIGPIISPSRLVRAAQLLDAGQDCVTEGAYNAMSALYRKAVQASAAAAPTRRQKLSAALRRWRSRRG